MISLRKSGSYFAVFLLLATTNAFALGERPSLKKLVAKIEQESGIKTQISKRPIEPKAVREILKANRTTLNEFYKLAKESAAFARGEMEDEKVLHGLTRMLQLSILDCRLQIVEKKKNACAESVPVWFAFVADLSYEETTLVALRFAHVVRSLWMDELEAEMPQNQDFAASAQAWTKQLRAPWPVDRVFLYEGKRVLHPASLRIVEKMALEYQKNPYQSADQLLAKVPGAKPQELDFVKKIWRLEDLASLKQEMNRIGKIRVLSAQASYLKTQSKTASGYQDLIKTGLLEKTPIDYETGRALDFPAAPASEKL